MPINVDLGRTNVITVALGIDVSADQLLSEIRTEKSRASTLIATWVTEFLTDGVDGKLVLTLDNSITSTITVKKGYMDIKRVTGGEPVSVFDDPIEVRFKETITV